MNCRLKMDRRDFIQKLSLWSATRWTGPQTLQVATASLRQLAQDKGLLFGSCLAMKYFAQSAMYQQLFLAHCAIATPEVHMTWSSLSNQPGMYDYAAADKLVAFCSSAHIKVRGHTLVWHQGLPAWVTAQLTAGTGQAMMTRHVRAVVGHFAGKVYSWNVVNEVLDPGSRRPDGLRDSPWLQNCGVGYIELAFRAAAAADPRALLVWNDTYFEVSNGFGRAKRTALLALLDSMLARGVPIHGIGLQAHLRGDQAAVLGDGSYEEFLGQLARRGMNIYITELDVQDVMLPADVAVRDRAVADIYSKFLGATLRQPAVKGVVTWGLADCFTWITAYRPRKDGLPVRPLPFDANCQPKAAYYAIAQALQAAPHRENEPG